jgi:protein-S-isoprenylcysteine O-methyltransferase Ste14
MATSTPCRHGSDLFGESWKSLENDRSLLGHLRSSGVLGGLGVWLRRHRSQGEAEKCSRVAHFLFFAGLVLPPSVGFLYPGITQLDALVGFHPLAPRALFLVAGILLLIPGLYFLAASNRSLRAFGQGANAFRLTKLVVASNVYQRPRNPMSLGFYLFALAISFISGSTLFTLGVFLGLVPAHLLAGPVFLTEKHR